MKQTFEITDGCNLVTIEQQGNKIVTTFEPEVVFKDGDIISCDGNIIIYRKTLEPEKSYSYCRLSKLYGLIFEPTMHYGYIKDKKLSPESLPIIQDALAKVGKKWNAEKKCVEDLKPKRWRAEYGVYYWHLNSGIEADKATDFDTFYDELKYLRGNYFQTRQQALAAAEKIKELLIQINP